jgi:hypothetical protein
LDIESADIKEKTVVPTGGKRALRLLSYLRGARDRMQPQGCILKAMARCAGKQPA